MKLKRGRGNKLTPTHGILFTEETQVHTENRWEQDKDRKCRGKRDK